MLSSPRRFFGFFLLPALALLLTRLGRPTANAGTVLLTAMVGAGILLTSTRSAVLGGLIISNKGNTTNGLPLLDRIPILGGLFGKQNIQDNRSEIIMFITPRVVSNELDYESVINDLRRRMENLDRQFPGTSTWPASPPSPVDQLNQFLTPKLGPLTPPPPSIPRVASPAGQPTQTTPPPPLSEPMPPPEPEQKPQ